MENAQKAGIEAVIAIGEDDMLTAAHKMADYGLKCVGVPKTIDSDIAGTDYAFGFNTAVHIATEALDRLHTTAEAHNRVMGRYAGHIALAAGTAGEANAILIPEKPFDEDEVCEYIRRRHMRGRNFSLIVVAEGTKPKGGK